MTSHVTSAGSHEARPLDAGSRPGSGTTSQWTQAAAAARRAAVAGRRGGGLTQSRSAARTVPGPGLNTDTGRGRGPAWAL